MRENPSGGALQEESEVNRFNFVKIVLNLQTKLVKNYQVQKIICLLFDHFRLYYLLFWRSLNEFPVGKIFMESGKLVCTRKLYKIMMVYFNNVRPLKKIFHPAAGNRANFLLRSLFLASLFQNCCIRWQYLVAWQQELLLLRSMAKSRILPQFAIFFEYEIPNSFLDFNPSNYFQFTLRFYI